MEKKNGVIICLIVASVFLYVVASQLAEAVFDKLNILTNRDYVLTVPEYIGILIAGGVFVLIVKNITAMEFFNDVASEMLKVVYPTPKESGQSAVIVIIMVSLATLVLAVYDLVWSWITSKILSTGA